MEMFPSYFFILNHLINYIFYIKMVVLHLPKNQGFGPVLINGKNYEVIKVRDSLTKRRYDISDNLGFI